MKIRKANLLDASAMHNIETSCFPKEEAASLESIRERIKLFEDVCLVAEEDDIIGFVNGAISSHEMISDEFYKNMVSDGGSNVLIFSLAVHPSYVRKGYGRLLLDTLIGRAKELGKKKIVLACKEEKIDYYASFGFDIDGNDKSIHGGTVWHSMTYKVT